MAKCFECGKGGCCIYCCPNIFNGNLLEKCLEYVDGFIYDLDNGYLSFKASRSTLPGKPLFNKRIARKEAVDLLFTIKKTLRDRGSY